MNRKYLIPGLFVLGGLILAAGFGSIAGNMSLTDIQGDSKTFYTDGGSFTPYADYTEKAKLYGQNIYVENHDNKVGDNQNVGTVNIGSFSKDVDLDESVSHNGITVKVNSARDTVIYDGYPYSSELDNYISLGWRMKIDIPKDYITGDFKDIKINKVSPGNYKLNYTLVVNNKFGELKSDNIYVEGFGKKVNVPTKSIKKGKSTYDMVTKYNGYNPSKYKVEEKVSSQLQLVVEDPWIPMDQKYFDGAKVKENPDFGIETFKSEAKNESFTLGYCGENAQYQDGECVIDNELHLRGDSCFMPQNYTMVTQSFTEGTVDMNDLTPNPAYFCSRHPVDIINDGVQTDTSTDPYNELIKNGKVDIPEDQTYTFFWIVDANDDSSVKFCNEGTYNKTTGNCVVTPGVVHKCSGDSVWSPETGACVVNAETKHVCDDPTARYNEKVNKCVVQITETKCPVGAVEGPDGEVCYKEASVKDVCPNGIENGKVENGKCVSEAEVVLTQQNLLGDWLEAIDNTWMEFTEWIPMI